MPISQENRARYPKDWPAIAARIRARAGGRCERAIDGARCEALHGKPHPITGAIVVLTVMHLDHTPENCADDNLQAACQRCHNRYDAPYRQRNAARTRAQRRARADLFEASR